MKSLAQYLAESERTYAFKLRSIAEMSDDQMDKLEKYLARYNVESVSAPKKSILQRTPAGFGDAGPSEVHTVDIVTRLATTPNALHEEISAATGIPMAHLRVYNGGESIFVDEVDSFEMNGEENKESILADSEYKDADKVKHDENFGNDFVEKFVKAQPKSELNKEYKV